MFLGVNDVLKTTNDILKNNNSLKCHLLLFRVNEELNFFKTSFVVFSEHHLLLRTYLVKADIYFSTDLECIHSSVNKSLIKYKLNKCCAIPEIIPNCLYNNTISKFKTKFVRKGLSDYKYSPSPIIIRFISHTIVNPFINLNLR